MIIDSPEIASPGQHWRLPYLRLLRRLDLRLRRKQRPPHPHHATIALSLHDPVTQVDEEFLSYSIDISVLAGGFWWEGSQRVRKGLGTLRVPPLDLNSKKLDRRVQALGPAYLRIGGSEADKIHYFERPADDSDSLVLTREIWDNLNHFVQRNQLRFAFTVKYGLFQRKQHGEWCGSEVEKLLRYSLDKGYHIDVCELGNELNAYWAFHGLTSQPRARNLAIDYATFINHIRQFMPDAKVIGPGSAFWPKLGETIRPFSNITRRFLETCREQNTNIDIVDWHYYPFQSERSPVRTRTATLKGLLKPQHLNDFKKYAKTMRDYRDEFFPEAQIWTGETGSAQCGGQEKLSDRFASCFWWADQLGLGALMGQSVMIRQSLIGGEYGLLDRLTLKPRPDYWLSWLWKQLMGSEVYDVDNIHHLLRCYCHSTPDKQGKALLLINLSGKPLTIHDTGFGKLLQQYALTAKNLHSKKVLINGIKPRFNKGNISLEDFISETNDPVLAPYSINFWIYKR